jgi:hypothetical protein
MKHVSIYEEQLFNDEDQYVGKLAVIRVSHEVQSPETLMGEAIKLYVGDTEYNEFVEIGLDNPWVRVLITGINDLKFKDFADQVLELY